MNWNIRTGPAADRAVTPVIGIILMVAITVILAAVIGGFVTGIGDQTEASPQASLSIEYTDSTTAIEINHDGGDTLEQRNLQFKLNGTDVSSHVSWGSDSELTAGDTVELSASAAGGTWSSGDTVTVVWESDKGGSTVLATFEVP